MGLQVTLQLFYILLATAAAEIAMKFTKYPESVTAPAGDKVTFECKVSVPGERLAWRWRQVDQPADVWVEIPGTSDKEKMSTTLMVEVREDTPTSLYQCVAWYGAVSLASVPARLSVARLDLIRNRHQRRVIPVSVGNTVVLHCKEPVSEPPAVLSWWKEDGRQGSKRPLASPYGILIISNVTMADRGTYGCTASNELTSQVVDLPETTYLDVVLEPIRETRFLETNEFVGLIDSEGDTTVTVKLNDTLRLWCGAVDGSPPRVMWNTPKGDTRAALRDQSIVVEGFTASDEGIYSCTANPLHPIRRSWKVVALEPPSWKFSVANVNASEGGSAQIACGTALGHPRPTVHWLMNAEPLKSGPGIRANGPDLFIDRVEKKHAGIVQCFACNDLGCAYDAALLTVVPVQISDQEYPAEASQLHFPSQPAKRHGNKKRGKHKGKKIEMIPPSRPNVTRMSDESVMVSWTHSNQGLPIQFFKIQYREVNDSSPNQQQWSTASCDIPSHIHSYEIDHLKPGVSYKFRIAAVYSNQDNKSGKSSIKFYLKRGGFPVPRTPVLKAAAPVSSNSIKLEWTWSSDGGVQAAGFYVYYRASTTAGDYEKMTVPGGSNARSVLLLHLTPDTSYELKLQAYTEEAPSDFSAILVARTHKSTNVPSTTTEAPVEDVKSDGRAPGALVTAGGALGAAALLVILVVTLLLCRRAKRPAANKEKGAVPEGGGANGYIPAKVPITITANPMHVEGGDGSVEMSFLHNNNTGSNDDTLPHSRKNGPARQYV